MIFSFSQGENIENSIFLETKKHPKGNAKKFSVILFLINKVRFPYFDRENWALISISPFFNSVFFPWVNAQAALVDYFKQPFKIDFNHGDKLDEFCVLSSGNYKSKPEIFLIFFFQFLFPCGSTEGGQYLFAKKSKYLPFFPAFSQRRQLLLMLLIVTRRASAASLTLTDLTP
jgi:hypothetical protein